MRIALVTHKVGFQDGQGRVNYEIARGALGEGHHVTVVGESCDPYIATHPHGSFVRLLDRHLPTQMLRDQYFAARSASWLRHNRANFDIIQANGFVTWEPADVVAVHYVHSAWLANPYYPFHWASLKPYDYYQRSNTILNSRLEQRAFRAAKHIVAVSNLVADEVASLGIDRAKISVVCNGVDTKEFSPGLSARAEFGLQDNVPLALFVGDIRTPRKNLDSVLKAMRSVPELQLVVAGDKEASLYPAMASELGLEQRVHFLGKIANIDALMRSVDFFVFPSRYEPFGMAPLEAMAAGVPVIVSNRIGARDFIGAAGMVFGEPDDVSALAGSMQELMANPVLRQSMGQAGRAAALTMQWSQTVDGYLRVYEDLAQKRATSAELTNRT